MGSIKHQSMLNASPVAKLWRPLLPAAHRSFIEDLVGLSKHQGAENLSGRHVATNTQMALVTREFDFFEKPKVLVQRVKSNSHSVKNTTLQNIVKETVKF